MLNGPELTLAADNVIATSAPTAAHIAEVRVMIVLHCAMRSDAGSQWFGL
jgi:hypothetical protein